MASKDMRVLILISCLFSCLCFAALSARAATLPARAAALPKIVSLNMCADPYLMAFAAPDQILALTRLSRDTTMSLFAAQAMAYPTIDGRIEEILNLRPDIVVVSAYAQHMKQELLRANNIQLVELQASSSYQQARGEITKLGHAIGRTREAQAYLVRLDAALARATHAPRQVTILPLQRRGLTIGTQHLLNEIIILAGAQLANRFDGFMRPLRLEQAVAGRADYILLSATRAVASTKKPVRIMDRGSAFLAHPALIRRFSPTRRLSLDTNLMVCAGASTPMAVQALNNQLSNQLTQKTANHD